MYKKHMWVFIGVACILLTISYFVILIIKVCDPNQNFDIALIMLGLLSVVLISIVNTNFVNYLRKSAKIIERLERINDDKLQNLDIQSNRQKMRLTTI